MAYYFSDCDTPLRRTTRQFLRRWIRKHAAYANMITSETSNPINPTIIIRRVDPTRMIEYDLDCIKAGVNYHWAGGKYAEMCWRKAKNGEKGE